MPVGIAPYLLSTTVFVYYYPNGAGSPPVAFGYAEMNGSQQITIDTELANVRVGIPFVGEMTPVPAISEDQLGPLAHRPHRVVSARIRYENARMFYINDVPQLEHIYPQPTTYVERPLRTGVATHRLLGWNTEPEISIRSAPPFQIRILSMTREVAG
jgi:hypothetical protein